MEQEISQIELIRDGAGLRAVSLVKQASYTLNLAQGDGEALYELLPNGLIEQTQTWQAEVDAAGKDKTVARDEATSSTTLLGDRLRELKIWRRRLVKRAQRARRNGAVLPEPLLKISRADNPEALLKQSKQMIDLAANHKAGLAKAGGNAEPLIAQGVQTRARLAQADTTQEAQYLLNLPEKVRAFYLKKGQLYNNLKTINDAGQELHADDPHAAGRYNLLILYHRQSKGGGEPPAKGGGPAAS